jgi:hypothetical protein
MPESNRWQVRLVLLVAVFAFAGCGAESGEQVDSTTDDAAEEARATTDTSTATTAASSDAVDQTTRTTERATHTTTAPSSSNVDETNGSDDVTITSCSDAPAEWRDSIAGAAPAAPAPAGLAQAVLPSDRDAVTAVFDALPDELIGGTKTIVPPRPGVLMEADYPTTDRASRDGIQAIDLETHMAGGMLPEPRADMMVAATVLSDDDDYTVESAGHDGDLYWVTSIGTNSGYGIDGVEEVYTITWGEACSSIVFIAQAPSDSSRNELIAAITESAATVASSS